MSDLTRQRRERQLEDDLSRLRRPTAPRVDVRARVMARIAGLRPERPLLRTSWLALAASVALAACLGLANATTLPDLPGAARDLATVTRAPGSAALGFASTQASSALASVSEAISKLIGFVSVLLGVLERYAWFWKPCLAIGFGAACITAAFILYREFKRAPRVGSLEETHHDA